MPIRFLSIYSSANSISRLRGCDPSQARTALENLTSLHGKILILTTFASSPCHSDIFTFKLQVSFLTCPSRPIPLPKNWTPTIESIRMCRFPIFGNYYAPIADTLGSIAVAGGLAAAYPTPLRGAPHPECHLISYLHTQRGKATSPLGYIGLSTPSCAACYKWIALYSSHKTQRFRHRGSRNAWSWPWVLMPGVDENDMAMHLMYCCYRWLRDYGLVGRKAPCSEVEVLMRDDELLQVKMREMEIWWQENDGACVFGCIEVDGCSCFSALYETDPGV